MKFKYQTTWILLYVASGIQFLYLSTLAMGLYPGGHRLDPAAEGYSFFANMISDLGATIAFSGVANTASCSLFTIAMVFLGIASMPFYVTFHGLFKKRGKGARVMSLLGSAAAIGSGIFLALAGFVPNDLHYILHLRMAQLAFLLMLVASILFSVLLVTTKALGITYVICMVTFATIMAVTVGGIAATGQPTSFEVLTAQATLQKVAIYSWNFFLAAVAYGTWRRIALDRGGANHDRVRKHTFFFRVVLLGLISYVPAIGFYMTFGALMVPWFFVMLGSWLIGMAPVRIFKERYKHSRAMSMVAKYYTGVFLLVIGIVGLLFSFAEGYMAIVAPQSTAAQLIFPIGNLFFISLGVWLLKDPHLVLKDPPEHVPGSDGIELKEY